MKSTAVLLSSSVASDTCTFNKSFQLFFKTVKPLRRKVSISFVLLSVFVGNINAQNITAAKTVLVANDAWANNSVNTVIFRKNSLCTYKNTQYIAYYNNDGYVVLGKRKLNSKQWQLLTTTLKGNVTDAHNSISIITDGDGYLHLSWNHHNNQLHYCKSTAPGSLQMTAEMPMTGSMEQKVSYPEFYTLLNGDLLFLYRDGQSGKGNLVINRYNTKEKKWQQLHQNLIDGDGKRNAYWQACVDVKGTIHLSWVWRESADVASNHDLCYAKSTDGGLTWANSNNVKYTLPVTAATAEYACHIPQKSELINQTSMCADDEGNPFIASYWKEEGDNTPQYHVVHNNDGAWQIKNLGFRKTAFSLSGTGTKRIPISRPQVFAFKKKGLTNIAVIFRDEEWSNYPYVAICNNINKNEWAIKSILKEGVGSWEPTYDTELWKQKKQIDLFVQFTEQVDGEGKAAIAAQPVKVISFKIK